MRYYAQFDMSDSDDKEDFKIYQNAINYHLALNDLYQFLRNKHKHHDYETEEARKLIEEIYSELFDIAENREIKLF